MDRRRRAGARARGHGRCDRLDRVLAASIRAVARRSGGSWTARVPGFDLTFSAPKSVSVLFGIGDDELRGAIRDAHDRAVAEALGYVERAAACHAARAGGVHVIAGRGLVAAAFRHRTSRAGDPQLHTHVLVANLVLGADGRWSALDGRRIYAHAKTAGYLYEARLRARAHARARASGGAGARTGSPTSTACRRRCCGRSAGGGRRSRRSSSAWRVERRRRAGGGAGDAARARTTASRRSSSCPNGASAHASSGSITGRCAGSLGREQSAAIARGGRRGASPIGWPARPG